MKWRAIEKDTQGQLLPPHTHKATHANRHIHMCMLHAHTLIHKQQGISVVGCPLRAVDSSTLI